MSVLLSLNVKAHTHRPTFAASALESADSELDSKADARVGM